MGMKRVHVLSAWAAAAAAIAALALPGVASAATPPFDTNAECLECHSVDTAGAALSKVDFTEAVVDRAAACSRCHWQSVHPVHNPAAQCQQCHRGMPWRADLYWANATTPYGYFTSASSANAVGSTLHDVHVNGSWPQTVLDVGGVPKNCVSCHAPAACDACHAAAPAHGAHSDTRYAQETRRVTRGVAAGDAAFDTTFQTTEGCTKAECHASSAAELPESGTVADDMSAVYAGTWWDSWEWGEYVFTFHETNVVGSTAAFTVTGAGELRVLGDRGAGAGAISVAIDGGLPQTVSCHGPDAFHGVVLFSTLVGPGAHTVVVTALAEPVTGQTLVTLDAVGVFGKAAPTGAFVPACASCHVPPSDSTDRTQVHGYETADHVADIGAQLEGGTACSACHAMDLATEHGKASSSSSAAGCGACHPTPRNTFTTWNDTCSQGSCHTVRHGGAASAHDAAVTGAACGGTGCHAVADVAAIHSESITTNAMHPTCLTCHGADVTPTKDCSAAGCHSSIVGHRTAHDTAASGECVACHENANVQDQHAPALIGAVVSGKTNDGCNICHGGDGWANVRIGNTRECVSCHNAAEIGGKAYSPAAPNHYPAASHAADIPACQGCHSADLKTEHAKPTVGVTCVACHETRVDFATAPWDKACETALCHATKHVGAQLKHVSTTSECGGTGCHAISDVDDIHASAPNGCNTCHVSASVPATTTNCLASGCHYGATASHESSHDTTGVIDTGCKGCHFTLLTTEHTKLGYTCATCHDSTNTAVVAAIAAGDRACSGCHPAVNGRDRHASQNATEFAAANASGHNSLAGTAFMKSSFVVSGTTYTMSLPSASTFLKAGWTTTSRVSCDGCHDFGGTAAGPHGAAVTVTIDPAYPTRYGNAILSQNPPGMSSGVICAKCHSLHDSGGSPCNVVHKEHDNRGMSEGGRCVSCHVSIPHGWRRPRLLGSQWDPAPYKTVSGGVYEFALKSYSPSSWQKSDCYAGCSTGRHPDQSNPWPAVAFGALGGVVTGASGSPLAGASVKAGTLATVTTAADGSYSIASAPIGTYTVTASKSGYVTQSKTAAVNANRTTTLGFALSLVPTTGVVTGTVTDSASAAKLAGVLVSVTGGGSATTDANGAYTLANVTPGTKTLTFSKSGYTTQTASVSVSVGATTTKNVALVLLPATNIAIGKTATASSARSGYEAGKAIDGSTSTRWYSSAANTQWLSVDLGANRTVEQVT
ncbi:MAG: hypothetical protein FDZ70_04505, partial [Actinobacteria bacterium]